MMLRILACAILLFSATVLSQNVATLRKQAALDQEVTTEPIANEITNDLKVSRNYPMQPPIIPHNIRDYQIDLNVNTCLACHSRRKVTNTQATMVSVTHYMDRDGNFLAAVSPRRYFCTQCHVSQTDAAPLVGNSFVDVKELMAVSKNENE
ncbi:nitrate reductase cytochrome c-type subunit [Alteromonas aestuariivivens]|uniref:Periplasmic nitrate reductase, electron transfer subunit n=1 Tax=Alteromonas aestuariivivens TaxID=1938339 RepID=A0A3D8M5R5_9ALTE|nr:nitrate reductase cytochrome c-type subunit [Alteromonas aestuariivivens]RDV24502.1 nitrate reductase cytochrome c-type subunit [Alteromonas aestuariivivens]